MVHNRKFPLGDVWRLGGASTHQAVTCDVCIRTVGSASGVEIEAIGGEAPPFFLEVSEGKVTSEETITIKEGGKSAGDNVETQAHPLCQKLLNARERGEPAWDTAAGLSRRELEGVLYQKSQSWFPST